MADVAQNSGLAMFIFAPGSNNHKVRP